MLRMRLTGQLLPHHGLELCHFFLQGPHPAMQCHLGLANLSRHGLYVCRGDARVVHEQREGGLDAMDEVGHLQVARGCLDPCSIDIDIRHTPARRRQERKRLTRSERTSQTVGVAANTSDGATVLRARIGDSCLRALHTGSLAADCEGSPTSKSGYVGILPDASTLLSWEAVREIIGVGKCCRGCV